MKKNIIYKNTKFYHLKLKKVDLLFLDPMFDLSWGGWSPPCLTIDYATETAWLDFLLLQHTALTLIGICTYTSY